MISRRFDLSMSKRTRKPKVFNEEEELEKEEDELASLHHSSLKELMTDNNSRRTMEEESFKGEEMKAEEHKEDEVVEMERLDRGETVEEKSSNLALVTRKGSFIRKYMKVLKRLVKAKRDPVERSAVIRGEEPSLYMEILSDLKKCYYIVKEIIIAKKKDKRPFRSLYIRHRYGAVITFKCHVDLAKRRTV
ncbi:hypothetical protein IEQ34_016524 [Dendrobium chrysotoxum]|uniref:Ribosomal protein S7 n=1 Tax=Dendrobium chrysotoxum TaxID=161865 RepID=A0AAV7GED6_DENCH|nr:hypothetical protein IEQ34_016524 [Dendrobium chrysotoxum]